MPGTNLPTFTSPLVLSDSTFPPTFSVSPLAAPRPRELAVAQGDATAYTAQPAQPVVLLPETGANLGAAFFGVVFIALCCFAAWVGDKRR